MTVNMLAPSNILMIRPVNFDYNKETAVNNSFQIQSIKENVQIQALKEFNDFAEVLTNKGINVFVVNDTPEPHTPDSIFPNNWISFHKEGIVVLYPMFAHNRRMERKQHVMDAISKHFVVKHTIDFSSFEEQGKFLEGTGSMVLDREKMVAYACLSPRTDRELFKQFCKEMHYHPVLFTATDKDGRQIYHTNVMMCVADQYVIICLEAITNEEENNYVITTIHNSAKTIIPISLEQMNKFAGNMLQLRNEKGESLLVMSSQAYDSLSADQREQLESFNEIIHSPLNTIETNGGGSARCMMAEIFLPVK